MEFQNGWVQVEPIIKSEFTKEEILGKATVGDKFIYYYGSPTVVDGKYFVKDDNVIAYE